MVPPTIDALQAALRSQSYFADRGLAASVLLALLPGAPQNKLRGGYVTCMTRPQHLLESVGRFGSLRVVASPGHTPDHVAFYDERDGTLLAGDAFQTKAGTAVAGVTRWLFPFPAMATWHLPTAVESARALRDLRPSRLAVGHGRVLEHPAAEMDRVIREAEAKIGVQAQTA